MSVETTETTTEAQKSVVLTDGAAAKVKALLDQEGRDDLRLRIAVQPGGCSGLRYSLFFDERSIDGDQVTDFNGVEVVVDRMSVPYLMRRDDRLRRHHRAAGLHDRQPQRDELLRLRRLVQLGRRRHREPRPEQSGAALRRSAGGSPSRRCGVLGSLAGAAPGAAR